MTSSAPATENRTANRIMKLNIVALSFCVSSILVLAGQEPRPGERNPLAGNAAAIAAGAERYARSCATCHGVDNRAPSLARQSMSGAVSPTFSIAATRSP